MAMAIRGGMIVDGSGKPCYRGDLLFDEETIRAVGDLGRWEGREIDARGKIVCPGFIDIHRHSDLAVFNESFGSTELAQGITTCFGGNSGMAAVPSSLKNREMLLNYVQPCVGSAGGGSFADYENYSRRLTRTPLPINVGYFAGLGAVRITVKGFDESPYTPAELEASKEYLQDALDHGAFGASVGLMYAPESYGSPEELAEIVSVMSDGKSPLCVNLRSETSQLVQSVEEVISIAKMAEVPLHISHFRAAGPTAWGELLYRAIALIERERAAGMDITVDFYPYNCGSSTLMQLIPPSFVDGNLDEMVRGLTKKRNVDRLRVLLERGEAGWDNLSKSLGWDRVIISSVSFPENQKYIGKTVTACTREFGFQDEVDFVAKLLHSERGAVSIINQSMSQADIDMIARLPYSMLISGSFYGDIRRPHPRLHGAFPHFLREYVRERKVLSMEEAISKMTWLPAKRVGLDRYGLLAENYVADILVFDPSRFEDNANYENPTRSATGLDYAFIGGKMVWERDRMVARSTGKFLASLRQPVR